MREQDYIHTLRDQVQAWDAQIDVLRALLAQTGNGESSRLHDEFSALMRMKTHLLHKLADLRVVDEMGWDCGTAGLDEARRDFATALERFAARLRAHVGGVFASASVET